MKKVLLSTLKFVALFVPAYLIISWFQPALRVQMLEGGLLSSILLVLLRGLVIGVVLMGSIALIDKFKKKKEDEEN